MKHCFFHKTFKVAICVILRSSMALDTSHEIVITLTPKRIVALSLLVLVSLAAVYSYVVALYAFIAPSQDLPLQISGTQTGTPAGVAKTAFARGETVRVKSTIEKATAYYNYYYYYVPPPVYYYYYDFVGTTSYRAIITVKDSAGQPVFFTSTTGTINVGATVNVQGDYTISGSAATGTYTVDVLVWSDWLPTGIVLAPERGEVTFSVS